MRISVCMSMDGRVAMSPDSPPNQEKFGGWTSKDDKGVFKENVDWSDCLIVGSTTLKQTPALLRLGKPVKVISRSFVDSVRPDRKSLERMLAGYKGNKMLLCGGVMTYGTFLQFGLVDEVSMVVEPVVLNTGPSFATERLFNIETGPTKFWLDELELLNNKQTIHMRYVRA